MQALTLCVATVAAPSTTSTAIQATSTVQKAGDAVKSEYFAPKSQSHANRRANVLVHMLRQVNERVDEEQVLGIALAQSKDVRHDAGGVLQAGQVNALAPGPVQAPGPDSRAHLRWTP
jgi:hypothetical protein